MSAIVSFLVSNSVMQIYKENQITFFNVFSFSLLSLLSESYLLVVFLSICTPALFMDSLSFYNMSVSLQFLRDVLLLLMRSALKSSPRYAESVYVLVGNLSLFCMVLTSDGNLEMGAHVRRY